LRQRGPHPRANVKLNGFNDNNPLHTILFVNQQHTIFIKHIHHHIIPFNNNRSTL
jgi:hypothetical protein